MNATTQLESIMRELGLTDAELGRRVGRSSQQICRVRRGTGRPSPELALAIERETGGQVSRHELRPDVYPRDGALAG
jgi:DNA-binding transcriptional regulator YdaS (Cro superfamily)